jgi:N-methylhydantoinase B/oxoprolinase/acetone carboxylase alpha subunit
VMEQLAPIRVRHRPRRRGSGDAGRHRGGAGGSLAFEVVGDSPVLMALKKCA